MFNFLDKKIHRPKNGQINLLIRIAIILNRVVAGALALVFSRHPEVMVTLLA